MKIHLETGARGDNMIRSYTSGRIAVNRQTYTSSLIITPSQIIPDWPPQTLAELEPSHIEVIIELHPEVVILGTGKELEFPLPEKMRGLISTGIGFEVMDTNAACRTYNVLMTEGRRVVAGLMMEP